MPRARTSAGISGAPPARQGFEPSQLPDEPRPHVVPTRVILRALTRVLVEKGVMTRKELLDSVRAIQDRDGRS